MQQPTKLMDLPNTNAEADSDDLTDQKPPLTKLGALVVDDDDIVRVVVQLGLERNGFEVWAASNGRDAVNLYREHQDRIAVVLLDVCMPEMDGPQTLQALQELNPNVLACFMSGNLGNHQLEDLKRLGAACFIAKPFYMDHLADNLWMLTQGVPANLLPTCRV